MPQALVGLELDKAPPGPAVLFVNLMHSPDVKRSLFEERRRKNLFLSINRKKLLFIHSSRVISCVQVSSSAAQPYCLVPVPQSQLVLPYLLRRLIQQHDTAGAHLLAQHHQHGPHFSRSSQRWTRTFVMPAAQNRRRTAPMAAHLRLPRPKKGWEFPGMFGRQTRQGRAKPVAPQGMVCFRLLLIW
jgi:hypothetical protein